MAIGAAVYQSHTADQLLRQYPPAVQGSVRQNGAITHKIDKAYLARVPHTP
ncbi:hypothetical protein KOY48_03795 [Candidatus Minimicrobia naudis]|uniref:Uncharacterized protein n=1 Tax=Candidatus Minimicrobia naudis TaxID=2841263 RepID=A0A8F1MBZ2_9BACT|nr:hypothetical protein KOY48_03795 [Candidatus Minimicrobia naudis]